MYARTKELAARRGRGRRRLRQCRDTETVRNRHPARRRPEQRPGDTAGVGRRDVPRPARRREWRRVLRGRIELNGRARDRRGIEEVPHVRTKGVHRPTRPAGSASRSGSTGARRRSTSSNSGSGWTSSSSTGPRPRHERDGRRRGHDRQDRPRAPERVPRLLHAASPRWKSRRSAITRRVYGVDERAPAQPARRRRPRGRAARRPAPRTRSAARRRRAPPAVRRLRRARRRGTRAGRRRRRARRAEPSPIAGREDERVEPAERRRHRRDGAGDAVREDVERELRAPASPARSSSSTRRRAARRGRAGRTRARARARARRASSAVLRSR